VVDFPSISWRRVARACLVLAALTGTLGCEPRLIVGKWICQEAETPIPDKSAPVEVPWSSGFEDRFCEYMQAAGFCYATGSASYETVTSPVHSGRYSAAFSVASDDRDSVQARCVRQGALPAAAYYGTWYFIPKSANTDSAVWNLIHFQGGDTSAQHGLWDISLVNASNGDLQLVVFDFLNGVGRMPSSRHAVPIGSWFHLQFYLKRAADETGEIALYLDGQQLLEVKAVITDDSDFGQWYVGNYADGIMPADSVLYVDDVTIASTL
jgi:Polysaccharide lyase